MILVAAIGVLQILVGAFIWYAAQSAIHEILAALLIGFGLLSIGIALVVGRLDALIGEARKTNRTLFELRHPRVPWPPLPANRIVLEEWRHGQLQRMRADGQWEAKGRFGKWTPVDADDHQQR